MLKIQRHWTASVARKRLNITGYEKRLKNCVNVWRSHSQFFLDLPNADSQSARSIFIDYPMPRASAERCRSENREASAMLRKHRFTETSEQRTKNKDHKFQPPFVGISAVIRIDLFTKVNSCHCALEMPFGTGRMSVRTKSLRAQHDPHGSPPFRNDAMTIAEQFYYQNCSV